MNQKKIKKILGIIALSTASCMTYAADLTSDLSVSGNVGLYSDYIFRGFTQTDNLPALQGGFDLNHTSGFYLGTWASNVSWTRPDYTKNNSVELDVYGGYTKNIKTVDADLGVLSYFYPGDEASSSAVSADATEGYVKFSKDIHGVTASVSFYVMLTNEAWGFSKAQGSQYYSGDIDIPLGLSKATLSLHLGSQRFSGTGNDSYDYTDWKANLEYSLNDTYSVGAFYTGTDQDKGVWNLDGTYVGDNTFGAYLASTF